MVSVDLASVAPSLVIGTPSGADIAELRSAYVLASQRLKTSANAPFTIEQITAALADLEENLKFPRKRLWYQVPANPEIVRRHQVVATRDERPDVNSWSNGSNLARNQDANPEELAILALASAVRALYGWRWEESAELSETCLELSGKKEVRDEALNVLAATLLARGETEKALAALREATEGAWNFSLQTNLAVVASQLDVATAVNHMSHLIDRTEDSDNQLQAVLLAVALWTRSQGKRWGLDDEDNFNPPPPSVLGAIRSHLDSSDISEEDFYHFGMLLARVDAVRREASELFTKSPHTSSPSGRLVKARINGFFDYVAEFGPIAEAREERSRPWIAIAIEQYVRTLRQMMADNSWSETQKFAILQSYRLFGAGLPTDSVQRVLLLVELVLNFETILPVDAAPRDVVDEWLAQAFRDVSSDQIEMVGSQKETTLGVIAEAAYALMQYRHKEIIPAARQAENQSQRIAHKTSGDSSLLTAERSTFQEAARPILDFCAESKKTYLRLQPMLQHKKARESIDAMISVLDEISARIRQLV
jgi:tetratricopeptide (TPR) repeat protein